MFGKGQKPNPGGLGARLSGRPSPGVKEKGEAARNVRGKEGTGSIYEGPGVGVGICRSRRGTCRNTPGPLEEHATHAHARPVPGGTQEGGKWGPRARPRPGGAGSPLESVGDGEQQLALLERLHLLEGLVVQGQEAAARVL